MKTYLRPESNCTCPQFVPLRGPVITFILTARDLYGGHQTAWLDIHCSQMLGHNYPYWIHMAMLSWQQQ